MVYLHLYASDDHKDHLTKEKKAAEYSKAWRDVIDALVTMYTPSHFAGISLNLRLL